MALSGPPSDEEWGFRRGGVWGRRPYFLNKQDDGKLHLPCECWDCNGTHFENSSMDLMESFANREKRF